jgi:dTDP-glucose 4,6-dehydratase/UDP-glucose 4-epimerase
MIPHRFSYDIAEDVLLVLKRSSIKIEDFRGKTVLVTGGTGFFGVWMLSSLAAIKRILGGDLRIVALSRDPKKFLDAHPTHHFASHIEFISGDVKTFRINVLRVNLLIHMAATNASETFYGQDQLSKIDMLYLGTKNVLEQCGDSLEKVVFTSSGVAYGVNTSKFISEDDWTGPDTRDTGSALAIGKLSAEYLVSYYAEKLGYKYSIARCFAFAGQYLPMDLHYAFGNFILDAMQSRDIVIQGDGKDKRSYLYVGDAVAWLLRLLANPYNDIFNVGSQNALDMNTLANKIALRSNHPIKVVILNKTREYGNFSRATYTPSLNKIKAKYHNLSEWTSIEEIIDRLLKPLDCV